MKKFINGEYVDLTQEELTDYNNRMIAWTAGENQRILDSYVTATQEIIDQAAQAKGYDNGFSCASYVTSTNPQWAAEAQAFVAWRDQVWNYGLEIYDSVVNHGQPVPAMNFYLNGLPAMSWPS